MKNVLDGYPMLLISLASPAGEQDLCNANGSRGRRAEQEGGMSGHYDVDAVRKEFPAVEKMTYLDSGFQAPLARPVKAAFERFLNEGLGSAGPKHVWLERMEQTRSKVSRFLGVSAHEIAFTKNTSEAMNIAANALPLVAGDN